MPDDVRLPRADQAVVPKAKLVGYLLSDTHPVGRAKARFFASFGFRTVAWGRLAAALGHHAREAAVVAVNDTAFGTRYVLEGPLRSPDGRAPNIRSVWFVEEEAEAPRLVTAYPRSTEVHE